MAWSGSQYRTKRRHFGKVINRGSLCLNPLWCRFEAWSFSRRCPSSLGRINKLALDSGGNKSVNSLRQIIATWLNMLPREVELVSE